MINTTTKIITNTTKNENVKKHSTDSIDSIDKLIDELRKVRDTKKITDKEWRANNIALDELKKTREMLFQIHFNCL